MASSKRALYLSVALFCAACVVLASSHGEAPGTTRVKSADLSDLYAFQSYESGRAGYTVFIMNANPLQVPAGGPNFYALSTDHLYYLHIDNDGDGNEDITFEFLMEHELGGTNESTVVLGSDMCSTSTFTNVTTQFSGEKIPVSNQTIAHSLKYSAQIFSVNASSLVGVNFKETYTLNLVTGPVVENVLPTRFPVLNANTSSPMFTKPADYAGPKTFPDYAAYADLFVYDIDIPFCSTNGRVFVGQRKESFAVNLAAIFDLLNLVPVAGAAGAVADDDLNNSLRGFNIDTFALEIPTSCLNATNGVVATWATVRQLSHSGANHIPLTQYARLGHPLVNEVLIGLQDKALYNAFDPSLDAATFLSYVQYPTLPEIIDLLFSGPLNGGNRIAPTNFPRDDLVQTFLFGLSGINTLGSGGYDALRLNTSVAPVAAAAQNNLGVIGSDGAGFPNGRRPGDDVVDIALDVLMGRLCHAGLGLCVPGDAPVGTLTFLDGAPQNAQQFDSTFPFLVTPLPGFVSNVVAPATTTTTTTTTTTSALSPAAEMSAYWEFHCDTGMSTW